MSTGAPKVWLIVSLVLNVFLLGGIAGGAYQYFAGRHVTAAREPQQRVALRFAADELSPERRQQFIGALMAARREGQPYAREARQDRREVLRLLAAPQLDRAALDAALARTREADVHLRAQVEGGVADFAASLTPEERAKFAQGLMTRGQWREPAAVAARRKEASEEGK